MSEDRVRTVVTAFLEKEFPHRVDQAAALAPDAPLFELGFLDSLSFLGLVTEIEAQFGIDVPAADFAPEVFRSLAAIAAYVERTRRG